MKYNNNVLFAMATIYFLSGITIAALLHDFSKIKPLDTGGYILGVLGVISVIAGFYNLFKISNNGSHNSNIRNSK